MTDPTTGSPGDPLDLASSIRPQGFGTGSAGRIVEPVVEPLWPGVRVIAGVRGEDVVLVDDGAPIEGHHDIRAALATAIATTADGAVLDGYLTKQVVAGDLIAYSGYESDVPSTGALIVQSMVGVRRNRTEEATRRLEAEQEARTFGAGELVNLVVTDLLWVDGEWLLDVPLLERRRLLDAVVPAGPLVRPGPYVRPPVHTWVGSWRAQGFPGISYKAANARYRPGESPGEWVTTAMPRR